MEWQIQQAKQRFSELVRRAEADGPQVVTRHSQEVVVVMSASDYRRLRPDHASFKDFLRSAPDLDALDLTRDSSPPRAVSLPPARVNSE